MNKVIFIIGEDINLFRQIKAAVNGKFVFVEYPLALSVGLISAMRCECCLAILSIPMTDEKSFALLLEILKVHDVPILVISSKTNVVDVISTIRRGTGNDLPVDAQAELLQCHDLFIDISKRIVSVKEKHISLTPKEFDILCFFAANQGRVFSKEQIYNHIWGTDYVVDDSNITAHIRRVRKKIEPNPSNPIYIKTVWGVGYRFCES